MIYDVLKQPFEIETLTVGFYTELSFLFQLTDLSRLCRTLRKRAIDKFCEIYSRAVRQIMECQKMGDFHANPLRADFYRDATWCAFNFKDV